MKRINAVAAAALAAACLSGISAYAQYGFGRGHAGYGMGFPGSTGHMLGVPGAGWDMAALVERQLATLHTRLAITPAQETAWQAYANAAIAQARQMQQFAVRTIQSPPATAPQRMAAMAELMREQAESASDTAEAMAALYAALTPQQRALLDRGAGWCGNPGPFGC